MATSPSARGPRFSWPMRLFLTALLVDIIYHSFSSLTPYRDWLSDWKLERYPKRLPTWGEIEELRDDAPADKPSPLVERVYETLDSAWDYFKPWPPRNVRGKIVGWEDRGMFLLAWTTSRLDFFENLIGVPQRWSMFSPNASKEASVGRIRLLYADGSRRDVRLLADPEDLTRYSHWLEEKVLDCELKVIGDWDSRYGYCNYIAHRHARNAAGSPVTAIYVYKINYRYPNPGEDAHEVLKKQSGPPDWDRDGPAWEYRVETARMRKLSDGERAAMQKRLARAQQTP